MNHPLSIVGKVFLFSGLYVGRVRFFRLGRCKASRKKPTVVAPRVIVEVSSPVLRNIQRTGRGQGAIFAKKSIILSNKCEGYVMAPRVCRLRR